MLRRDVGLLEGCIPFSQRCPKQRDEHYYCPFVSRHAVALPWHHCGKTLHDMPRSLPQTSTAYHGTLTLTPTIGAVGVAITCRRVTMEGHGGCRGGWHGTTHVMPPHPPRRAMESYASSWDALGMSWYAMCGTMATPRHATKKLNSVENCPDRRYSGASSCL